MLLRRLTQSQQDLGASTEEIIRFQEIVQKLMIASGTATSEAQAGTLQLSQALASGKVQGDEFRSVMENMSEVARAAARGLFEMGKIVAPTIGELNRLRETGALTAEDFFEAVIKGGARADAIFAQMPDTLGRAGTSVSNEFTIMAASIDKLTGGLDALLGS